MGASAAPDRWDTWHCHKKRLTSGGWQRALYVDFEGRKVPGELPTLLGVLYRPGGTDWAHCRFVFDRSCAAVAKTLDDGTEHTSHSEALAWLLDLSSRERRPVVSWSCHDIRWIKRFTGGTAFRHRNAIPTAKRWRRAQGYGPEEGDNSLQRYLNWIGYQRPDDPINVGSTIQQIRNTASITGTVKARWVALTLHNDHDLIGMREVLRVALGLGS